MFNDSYKKNGQLPKSSGRYATADEANRAKNADLIALLKKMNLKIVNGQPVVQKQQ